jgi:epoxyqueuosine reductase
MIAALKNEALKNGDRLGILPVERLHDLRQDVADLRARGGLNSFQQFITTGIYQFDPPQVDFTIRSILITATPAPGALRLIFQYQGKQIVALLPLSYANKGKSQTRSEAYLRAFLEPSGHHVCYAPQLPHKLTAVRSGLGRYGRNNICYVEGLGSFLNLNTYYSDLPCTQDPWQEIRSLELCPTCQACRLACPTGAILPERFLIDNERCLTYFNEAGSEYDFPDWMDLSAHHTLYGCLRCQMACPANRPYLDSQTRAITFDEVETTCLMEKRPPESFPHSLSEKVAALEMGEYLGAIPRNLAALMRQN